MPVSAPSLQEIIGSADPERGTGTPAVVYDSNELVRTLNHAAQFKAENDWRKYTTFLNNSKDLFKDITEIQKQPILQEDREALKNEMGEILKEIGKSPQSVFGGGPKFGEIQQRLAKLQSDTYGSKQDYLWNELNRAHLMRNPTLDTPENRALIEGYPKGKLGARQQYMLSMPGLFDPESLSKEISGAVKKPYSASTLSADKSYFTDVSGEIYPEQDYKALAEMAYEMPDERNVPRKATLQKRYDALPDYVKEEFKNEKDPAKAYYLKMLMMYKPEDNIGSKARSNPNYVSPLDVYKAQSGRISANASALRAQKYAQLSNKKLEDMDDAEKRTKGFWDGIVDRIQHYSIGDDKDSPKVEGDYIFSGNLPRGYRFMGGVGTDGKPIELEPLRNKAGTEYYKTKYYGQDGSVIDKTFLTGKYQAYKKSGGSGAYDDYIKKLIKSGVVDLEVQGQTRQYLPKVDSKGEPELDAQGRPVLELKMTPSVANFETASQAAKSITNKVNAANEEPIFEQEEQQPQE